MAALQVNATLGSLNPKTLLPNTVTTDREVSSVTLAAAAAIDAATLAAAVVVFESNKDDLATETGSLTTDVATFLVSKGDLNTHNGSAVTQNADVEALVAVLEADGIAPTQAHVNDLRAGWDILKATLALINTDNTAILADYTAIAADDTALAAINTLVATDYTDIAAASVLLTADTAAASAGSAGDVNVSWNTTNVTTISQLKTALDQVLRSAASSLAP